MKRFAWLLLLAASALAHGVVIPVKICVTVPIGDTVSPICATHNLTIPDTVCPVCPTCTVCGPVDCSVSCPTGAPTPAPSPAPTPTGTVPNITAVAGLTAQGQLITVSGSAFLQENKANWDPFFSAGSAYGFEGASPTGDQYDAVSCASYDSSVKLMGSQSIKFHDSGQHIHDYTTGGGNGGCMLGWQVQAVFGTGPADVYLRAYSRWNNNSWPDSAIKYWWMSGSSNYAYYNLAAQADGSAPTQWGVSTSGGAGGDAFHWGNIPGGAIKNNRWYLFEAHFRRMGSGGYIFEGWIDNQLVLSIPSSDGPGPPNTKEWESNVNYWNTTASFVSDQWQDGFAVSSTRIGPAALIEVSNNAVYGQGVTVYQAPQFLSDTSLQFALDLSGLGAGPYFLWVTNNQGQRSAAFALK